MHGGERLPFFGDLAVLRALDPVKLRNHAMKLYQVLGPAKIAMQVPLNYEDMLDWVLNVERLHLAPLRGLGSLAKAELKAERRFEKDLVRTELGYPYYGGSLARAELAAEAAAVDYVMHGGERLPFFGELAVLRTLDPVKLREHAMKLYRTLGPLKITTPVPVNYEDLVDWVS